MPENSSGAFQRQHRLALQSFAFVIIMIAPLGLYFAAQAGSGSGILALLVALGGGMLLVAWAG